MDLENQLEGGGGVGAFERLTCFFLCNEISGHFDPSMALVFINRKGWDRPLPRFLPG